MKLEREKAKMTEETVPEELNTDNQQQELTVADTSEKSSEETLLSA